jgi:ADP-ribose pyrophosphatase YjhB (NUDIX family)
MTSPPFPTPPQAALQALTRGRSFRHCKACGNPVEYRVPPGDNAERAVCTVCATVHYENPLNVVGAIPAWGDQVLLCRRAIEPRRGFWTLPAGFLELGETLEQGAIRETLEEAGARVRLQGLYSLLSVVRVGQVHLFYRAELADVDFAPGEESLEVELFREDEIPWEELAFRTVSQTLRWYFEDRRLANSGAQFALRCADIA